MVEVEEILSPYWWCPARDESFEIVSDLSERTPQGSGAERLSRSYERREVALQCRCLAPVWSECDVSFRAEKEACRCHCRCRCSMPTQ